MNETQELKIKNVLYKGMLGIEDAIMKRDPAISPLTKEEMVEIIYNEIIKSNLLIK